MIDLFNRIKEANKNTKAYHHDSSDTSLRGHEAEHEVCNALAPRLIGTGWELVNGVRVPDPTAKRRREMDFVFTGPNEAIVVELKNWTGEVSLGRDGSVMQRNRKGDLINGGKLFEDVADRTEILRLHHMSKGRTPVAMRHFVVFYDPYGNLWLDDAIASRPDVLRFEELEDLMPNGQEPFLLRLLHALMRFFGCKPQVGEAPSPSPEIVAFRQSLAELGGWDVILLHGGRTLCGDILSIGKHRSDEIEGTNFNRKLVSRAEFDVDRSIVASIFRAPSPYALVSSTGRDASNKVWNVPTSAQLTFHRAGDREPSVYEVRNMQAIQFGYQAKPKTTFSFDDFRVGMNVVGKVTAINDKGVFIDIGYREEGADRHARANPIASGPVIVGQRILARITRLIEDRKLVSIEILEPRLG